VFWKVRKGKDKNVSFSLFHSMLPLHHCTTK